MDYEKEYKELVAKLTNAYNDESVNDDRFCCVMNGIMPELAESEDENIRKELLSLFKDGRDGVSHIYYDSDCERYIAWLEKQGEQKPLVVHKFNVGDVIVNDYCMGRVIELTNDAYLLDTEQGIPFSHEHNAHLWTIKDAKDGDVLYLQKDGKEHIIIYKGVIKERFRTFVSAYCAYNGIVDAFCFADVSRYVDIAYEGIMPATKEQRDLLFQKMKEEGYEWDADKKELKKIEQNPTWSEEDEIMVARIIDELVAMQHKSKTVIEKNFCQEKIDWLNSIKDRVLPQPKQEWSEEDEKHLKGISLCLSSIDNLEDPETWINWFKNLKDRVQSKPKQWKPTEMQLTCLEDAINAYHRDGHPAKCLTSLLNDLKAL